MSTTDAVVFGLLCHCSGFTHFTKINAKTQLAKNRNCRCTKFRHPPVDELHSLENKRDKIAKKWLTYKIGVVKHTRSLTVSKVLPVGGKSGAEASSLFRARGARQQRDSNGQ
jgi:hypothetical protein